LVSGAVEAVSDGAVSDGVVSDGVVSDGVDEGAEVEAVSRGLAAVVAVTGSGESAAQPAASGAKRRRGRRLRARERREEVGWFMGIPEGKGSVEGLVVSKIA
jgi:hypothetical protein